MRLAACSCLPSRPRLVRRFSTTAAAARAHRPPPRPAARSTGVSPLLRGVEIGLAHGFLLVGPFIK